jgi:hypothetical protein
MFSADSVRVSSGPDSHVLSVIIVPDLGVFLLLVGNVVFHDNNLVVSTNVSIWNSSVINVDLSVHFEVLILESDQILVIFMTLDGNGAVVIKVQVKQ